MQKLVIAVLAAGALVAPIAACDPDTGSGGNELRRNAPATTTAPPTTTEHRLPRIPLPHITLPGELRGGPAESSAPEASTGAATEPAVPSATAPN
ncbi:hypothetical protein [Nocardia sp. BMG51109]|uniref:hypothetical protein n=1 Tax=Nocardia sp. BMG51109 TaxID=1056816 RepID=UPI0012EBA24B|nr:hypothetical protein [Nocardia sp. BMG51109]